MENHNVKAIGYIVSVAVLLLDSMANLNRSTSYYFH